MYSLLKSPLYSLLLVLLVNAGYVEITSSTLELLWEFRIDDCSLKLIFLSICGAEVEEFVDPLDLSEVLEVRVGI